MSDFEAEQDKVAGWLQALEGESSPCGPDLEYDNDFLLLTQAAVGKPESQFGSAEAPDWRAVLDMADSLLGRSRDLRIAIFWARALVRIKGFSALPVGLQLINGLIDRHWEQLHPQPDPDDGDPYARVNALTLLRETDGLMGDLRAARLIDDRAIGNLTVRVIELASGHSTPAANEEVLSREQVLQMLGAALVKRPELRTDCNDALTLTRQLIAAVNDKLGSDMAPDLRPIYNLLKAVTGLLPADSGAAPDRSSTDDESGVSANAGNAAAAQRGLAGSVNSRDDAIRAIDMVCLYLERTEPTNPAPLFLRRGRQLIGQNFLQLIKALAPEALSGVAGMVGVDPDAVVDPEST
jgi:type VI secretion system protein ImpA